VAEQGKRPPKHYRLIAYENASPELLEEVRSQHLRTAGGQQIGRFDPTEGLGDSDNTLGDDSCDPLDHETGGEGEYESSLGTAAPRHLDTSFEVIDINLACPVKKIKAKARGGHWLTEPAGAIKILEAVREAVPAKTPCTLKLRRSYDDTPEMVENFETIFDAAYAMGYSWATVHARTVEQKYIGPSRWTFLQDLVRRHPDKVIFGSGDVWDVNDIFRMIGYTGVSGVSVARGCIGNPWIFRQARQMMAGEAPAAPTIAEQRAVLEEHFRLSVTVNGEGLASRLMRKFAIRFAAHHPDGETVRREFIRVESIVDWRGVLERHYG